MIEKRCTNCKHFFTSEKEYPCIDCIDNTGFIKWEPDEEMQIKEENRPELLPKPLPVYERTDSRIPERVRISFTDGTSAIYDLHTDQPAPIIIENIKIIRRMAGYIAPRPRRRNRK